MEKLIVAAANRGPYWIGINDMDKNWKWSLPDDRVYGEGEDLFMSWRAREPNNFKGNEFCVYTHNRKWNDVVCAKALPFVCYDGKDPCEYLLESTCHLLSSLKTFFTSLLEA